MEIGSGGDFARQLLSWNLKKHRAKLGLSQEDLGTRCGFHRTYVSRIERLETGPTIDNVHRLAVGLGTTIGELFNEREFRSAGESSSH